MFNQSGSRRWIHFHSALQLAIQRSAHKWTFEDFAECFPLYVEEDKNGSSGTFNILSDHIEAQNFRDLDKLFKEYDVQESIDLLHKVVNEAKDRSLRGDTGNDVWKEDLEPRTGIAARTVPILETEMERLRESVEQMKEENRKLQAQLEENLKTTSHENAVALEVLREFDSMLEEWAAIPLDNIETWAVQKVESLTPSVRS